MQLTWSRLDLERTAAAGVKQPGILLARASGEQWVVSEHAVQLDRPTQFTYFGDGNEFYVPLFPYLLHREPDLAFGYMFAAGLSCIARDVRRPVKRLHIVTGVPVIEVEPHEAQGDRNTRYWLGFSFLLE